MTTESTEKAIQDTSEEKELSTGQRLFPDLLHGENDVPKEVISKDVAPEKAEETVETETKTEESPETETKTEEPKYLSLEELGSHLLKTKVDGEEQDVSVKDVLRGYQTDKYLTQKGQQLAEQFRQLERAKDGLIDKSNGAEVKASPEDEYSTDYTEQPSNTEVAQLKQQIEMLTNNLSSITATLAPTVYEQEIKSIDAYLKSQGYDDFMEHRTEIESYFNTLTVEQRAALTEGDVVNKYKDLKIAKMVKTQVEAAVKPVEERLAPTVVNINSGSGPPSGADEDDSKYAKAFAKAQESGNWGEVFDLKGYGPSGRRPPQ